MSERLKAILCVCGFLAVFLLIFAIIDSATNQPVAVASYQVPTVGSSVPVVVQGDSGGGFWRDMALYHMFTGGGNNSSTTVHHYYDNSPGYVAPRYSAPVAAPSKPSSGSSFWGGSTTSGSAYKSSGSFTSPSYNSGSAYKSSGSFGGSRSSFSGGGYRSSGSFGRR